MVLILILIISLTSSIDSKPIDAKQLFNKRVITPKIKDISLKKSYYADISVDDSLIYDVSIRFSGYVERLYVSKLYKRVSKGEALFRIYSDEVALLLSELKLLNSQVTYRRLKSLDIDKREFKRDGAIDIYSKYSGFIVQKNIEKGSFVKSGKSLFKIANLSRLWVMARVYQEDISLLKVGDIAKVIVDGVGEFKAKLDFIYPTVDVKSKTIKVRFTLKNRDLKLYPNMFAKVEIEYKKRRVLTLPKSAVLTKGKRDYVFIDKGDSFEPKEVKAIRINSFEFEIKKGLSGKEKIIDKAMFLLDSDAITNGLYDSGDDDW